MGRPGEDMLGSLLPTEDVIGPPRPGGLFFLPGLNNGGINKSTLERNPRRREIGLR
ncbi:MAG TPA: hypothetical protein VJ754_01025 [Anaerolineae bacterium]|nr:hypothetical protein [Anaerolineae bacterium]